MTKPWEQYQSKPWEQYGPQDETPQQPEEKTRGFRTPSKVLNTAIGIGENALTSVVGAADASTAGWKGIGAAIMPGGKTGYEAYSDSIGKWSYEPKSEMGQMLNDDLNFIGAQLDKGSDYIGEVTGDPDDTLGATMVKTGLLAAPMLLGLRGSRGTPAKKQKAPTIDELKSQAGKAYDIADNSGVAISKGSFESFVERVMNKAADEGIDPKLTPDSMAVLERLMDKSGNNFTLKGLEIERKAMSGAGSRLNPADQRMAAIIRREMDNYVENLGPNDMFGNTDTTAIQALKEARSNWSKARKSETLSKIFDDADVTTQTNYSVAGYETALRQGFKNLYKRIRDGKERGFSAEETAAIRSVATGGPMQNTLRVLGKFTPNGAVSGAASAYIASLIGGPLAATVPAIAWASRAASAAKTSKNARIADELVRGGKPTTRPTNKKALIAAGLLAPND